jgi:hypothetical protein
MMRGVSLQRIVFRARDEIEVALSLVGEPEKVERTVPSIAAVHAHGFRGNSNHKRHYDVFRVADSTRNWASAAPPLRKRKGDAGHLSPGHKLALQSARRSPIRRGLASLSNCALPMAGGKCRCNSAQNLF